MTAEEAEKNAKKDLKSYYKNMAPNVVVGLLGIILLFLLPQSIYNIFIFISQFMLTFLFISFIYVHYKI